MASEDAPVDVDAGVMPDPVASEIRATTVVLETVERLMLQRRWSDADRELFDQQVAHQEANHKVCRLTELNDKIKRQMSLIAAGKDAPFCVTNGKLEHLARLHATLIALRRCQAAAQQNDQKAKEDETQKTSKYWLASARQNQEESLTANRKSFPVSGGPVDLYAPRAGKPSRGMQQTNAANGKKQLPLQASRAGAAFYGPAAAANGHQRLGTFSSSGGPPGLTVDQLSKFKFGEGKSGGGGGGGGRAATKPYCEQPLGRAAPGGGGAAGSGRAKSSAATAAPLRPTRQTRRCDGCKFIFPQSEVNQSPSLDLAVCNDCERKFNQTGLAERAAREEETPFDQAMKKSKQGEPKKKKQPAEPVHIDLLTDGDDDADAEDKPVAETVRSTRPVRAAAAAAQSLSQRLAGMKALYPPSGDSHAVEVSASDLFHLQPSEFLNDTVIDLYLKKLERALSEPLSKRVHFFNTFFYKKLTQKNATKPPATENEGDRFNPTERSAHDRVKKWTKHVDIFSKDFVFVPVHSGLHWSLVIICHAGAVPPQSAPAAEEIIDVDGPARAPPRAVDPAPGSPVTQEDVQAAAPCAPDDPSVMDVDAAKPAEEDVTAMLAAGAEQPSAAASALLPSILHLDSMGGGHSTSTLSEKLRSYLSMEWERLALDNPVSVPARSGLKSRSFKAEVKLKRLALPQQNNSSDCGCFLLTYIEYFLKCMPDQLTSEHVKGLEKGKGISLPDCPDFLGEHWFDPVRGFNMREKLTNDILELFVAQAGEPQDDAARERLAKAQAALADGRASEEREADAATEKEVKYLEKLKRRAERAAAAAAAQDVVAIDSESEKSELPQVLPPRRVTRGKKAGDAGVAAAAADEEDEPRHSSGRPRRTSARIPAGYDVAGAPSDDDDFEPDQPDKAEKPAKKKPRKRLAPAVFDDEDDEAANAVADAVLQTAVRSKSRRAAAAGASAPAPPPDAIDVDGIEEEEGAPGFVAPYEGAPGFPEGYRPPLPPVGAARGNAACHDLPPPAAASAWGHPVPLPKSPEFNLVPSEAEQRPLKAPQPAAARKRKSAPAALEQHAAADVITVDDDDDVKPVDESPADAVEDNGTQSL